MSSPLQSNLNSIKMEYIIHLKEGWSFTWTLLRSLKAGNNKEDMDPSLYHF